MIHEIQNWLDKLSHMQSDDIAKFLEEEEITGRKDSHYYSCPIAVFLRKKVGNTRVAGVGALFVWTSDGKLELPCTVRSFVSKFDRGYYPNLKENVK